MDNNENFNGEDLNSYSNNEFNSEQNMNQEDNTDDINNDNVNSENHESSQYRFKGEPSDQYRYTFDNSSQYNSNSDNSNHTNSNSDNSYQNNNNYHSSQENNYYYKNSNSQYDNQNNNYGENKQKKPKKNGRAGWYAIIGVCAVLLVAVVAISITSVTGGNNTSVDDYIGDSKNQENETYDSIGNTEIGKSNDSSTTSSGIIVTDVSSIVDATMPSIVSITSTTEVQNTQNYYDDFFRYYFGGEDQEESYTETSAGSGIIVEQNDTELLIVTNNHVVVGADALRVQFIGQEGEEGVKGKVKGTDPTADVAIVAVKLSDIPDEIYQNIKKATIGNSDEVKVGEGVIAIGNALGYGQSVTSGVISAKDRTVNFDDSGSMKLLQTDAAINGGNSGGALINAKGEVIGINVAKYSSNGMSESASIEGMGFAIPISSVTDIISTLEKRETKDKLSDEERGYIGITGSAVTEEISQQYGLPVGVSVKEIVKDGPADKAGIKQYDVILKVDGQSVKTVEDINNILQYFKAGEKVKIVVSTNEGNGNEEKEVEVTLGTRDVITKK